MARIDIVNMGNFYPNPQAIDVALPAFAYECEASLPMENSLDAYEEAVLKLVSLGMSPRSIANALNASESMVEVILSALEGERYAKRRPGKPWELTEDGEKYLDGTLQERESSESVYGYMFVNAIKKEVLPYFYRGDIGAAPLFDIGRDGVSLPLKLTVSGSEEKTFVTTSVRQPRLRAAYQRYFRNVDLARQRANGDITSDEAFEAALDAFDGISFSESESESYGVAGERDQSSQLNVNMRVRLLKKEPISLYLRMRLIINPKAPGGYDVESPFDLGGVDNGYFLRQLQWLEQTGTTFAKDEELTELISREVEKIGQRYGVSEKDFGFFVTEKMPAFRLAETRQPNLYLDMRHIYSSMQTQDSLMDKEDIVSNISKFVVERLFNSFFRQEGAQRLGMAQCQALKAIRSRRFADFRDQLCSRVGLSTDRFERRLSQKSLRNSADRMDFSFGNSISEKYINMLLFDFILGNTRMHDYLTMSESNDRLERLYELRDIRNKVSHDTDTPFTGSDYDYYMSNVFGTINDLATALWKE